MTDDEKEDLELQRVALLKRCGPNAVLRRDVKMTVSDGWLPKRSFKGDLVISSSGLLFSPNSELVTSTLLDVVLDLLGPVGLLVQAVLTLVTKQGAMADKKIAKIPQESAAEVFVPYESILHIKSLFGTLYITVPRGTYGFSGDVPAADDVRRLVAALLGDGHLR